MEGLKESNEQVLNGSDLSDASDVVVDLFYQRLITGLVGSEGLFF